MFGVSQNDAMTKRRGHGDAAPYWSEPHKMWRAQIDVGWVDGKRQRKTVYSSTKQGCQKKLTAARRAKEAGDLSTSSMRLEVWLRYWLEEIAANEVKPSTLVDYRGKVETYLIPTIGRIRLDRLTTADVRSMHRQLRERRDANDKALSTSTIHHAHRVLANALNRAVAEGRRMSNPATVIEAPPMAPSKRGSFAFAEVDAICMADGQMPSRWFAGFVTGARQGELLGLRWSHVDMDGALLDFAWSLQRVPYRHGCKRTGETWACDRKRGDRCPRRELAVPPGFEYEILDGNLCLVRPKTKGSVRLVPMIPALHAMLTLHQQVAAPNPHDLVWHRPDGRPLDGRQDYRRWCELLEAAKLKHRTLHEARHTTATLLLECGVAQEIVSDILGHSQAVTTSGYQHVSQRLKREALNTLGERLSITG